MNAEEEIETLEEEIRSIPYHKGTEKHIGLLKARIAKLRKEMEKKREKKSKAKMKKIGIRKEGDGTVVFFEKPEVLKALTNAIPDSFKPTQGMMLYKDAQIQIVNFPQKDLESLSFVRTSDLIIIKKGEEKELNSLDIKTKAIKLSSDFDYKKLLDRKILSDLKQKIYNSLNLIRVYTRRGNEVGGAMTLKSGSTISEVCETIHKDLKSKFKYALVTGKSVKFSNQRVGLEHIVKEGDIITIIARK